MKYFEDHYSPGRSQFPVFEAVYHNLSNLNELIFKSKDNSARNV